MEGHVNSVYATVVFPDASWPPGLDGHSADYRAAGAIYDDRGAVATPAMRSPLVRRASGGGSVNARVGAWQRHPAIPAQQ